MFDSFSLNTTQFDHLNVEIAPAGLGDFSKIRGRIDAECIKPDGTTRWKVENCNMLMNLGFNYLLDAAFRNGVATLYANFYIGLIGAVTSGIAGGDAMGSHGGWTEDSTHYTLSNRPAWINTTTDVAATKSITNATPVDFPINTNSTVILGIFVTSDNTLGGSTGFLFSAGLFGSSQTLFSGDHLKITYTITLS